MEKIALSLHNSNVYHLHSLPTHYLNRVNSRHSSNSLALRITRTSTEAISASTSLESLSSVSSLSSSSSFRSLNELSQSNNLNFLKSTHAQVIKTRENWECDSVAGSLLSGYLQFSDFRSACIVFFTGFAGNFNFWNDFVEELERYGGEKRDILKTFVELENKGVTFDSRVLTIVLKICTDALDSKLGLEIHCDLIKKGLDMDPYLACALIGLYGACFGVKMANQIFDETTDREDFIWNQVLMLNLRNGRWEKAMELFRKMQFSSVKANVDTIVKMLHCCVKVGAHMEGKQIHGYVLKLALESDLSICNSLIVLYSKNGKLESARKVFDSMKDHNLSSWNSIISSYTALGYLNDAKEMLHRMESIRIRPDIVTWNSLLSGHALSGLNNEAVAIFRRMQAEGFKPNAGSVTSLLQLFTELGLLKQGKEIQGYTIRNGLQYDVYVETSLINMYTKNNCLRSGRAVFDNMNRRNIFAWNSLISGYASKSRFEDAKKLLNQMEKEGIEPDLVTWNSFLSGYAISGQVEEALAVINQIRNSGLTPNVVSWTALISGSSQNGNSREALGFFIRMQEEGVSPNSATISSLLQACGRLSLLNSGRELQSICIKNGLIHNIHVSTAFVDMYVKSGDLRSASEIFRNIANKTLASWNCMIMGFAIYGQGEETISLFHEMCDTGIKPDSITFTGLLSGCKNSGLVEQGWRYFDSMSTDYQLAPTIEHYCCMVDLLGKSGYLDEAWDLIQTMPLKPDASIWNALLGSCKIHKNLELAEMAAKNLFELEPYNSANYVTLMNVYAMFNKWEDVDGVRESMSSLGVRIREVWSWIQIDKTVHMFSAKGDAHPDEGEIYFELYHLVSEMKKLGYKPDTSCVYQNIEDEGKEKALMSHTEKLAITYGLIKTDDTTSIRVIKNTRVCSDCHAVAKYMSLIRNRDIVLRDSARVHHFRQGKCCCNDFW